MRFTFDPYKSERNRLKHGLTFDEVPFLDWERALFREDTRLCYDEQRFVVYVPKKGRLHIVCLTERSGTLRVISYRKANKREVRYYAQTTAYR